MKTKITSRQKAKAYLSAGLALAISASQLRAEDPDFYSRFNYDNTDYNIPVLFELAMKSEGDLEGRVKVDVGEVAKQSKEKRL